MDFMISVYIALLMGLLQGLISNILEEDVVQPLLVTTSAVELATETVCLLLKIDDYVQAR
jgi:T-complex protein 1 subunit delta